MKRNFILSALMLPAAMIAAATDFTGRVVDENDAAVEFATVSLLNPADSAFITGTTTGATGDFAVTAATASAIVKITYIGYRPLFINSTGSVGTAQLQPESTMLGEVTVTTTRPAYRLTTEGIKTDVDGTLLSKVGTAGKVLENLPGVQKKADGIEVFGKGAPLIYVNGRQLRDKTELDQIQSENIQSVELITNPGAKYKADVESVILIRTKRPQGEGFSLTTEARYYQYERTDADLGVSWNYRHGGLDVFGSTWYNDNHYLDDNDIYLDVNTTHEWHMDEHSYSDLSRRSLYASLGVNYIVNDRHALGFRYDTKAWFRNVATGTFTADVIADGAYYDHIDNMVEQETKSNMPHTLNAYYNGKIGGTGIDFNTDYMFFKDRESQWNDEVSRSQDSRTVTSRSVARNLLWASKLVLSWNLWGGNLQAGAEYDLTNRDDNYTNPEQVVPSSCTEQRERSYTAFVEYAHPLPFGQLRVGLRNENVTSDYYDRGVKIAEQSRTYHHFFPSVALMARAGKVQLMANYGMKIQRPYYFMLSSAVTYANRFTWQSGNPMLQPTVLHEAGVMAMWRWLNVGFQYKRSGDVIVNVCESVEGSPETTLLTRANVDHAHAIRTMITAGPKFGIYEPSLTVALIKDWIKIPSPVGYISPSKPIWFASLNNNLRITSTLTATANVQLTARGDKENMTLNHPGWYTYVSLTKTFLGDRLSVQVAGHNLLNAQEDVTLRMGTRTLRQASYRASRKLEVAVRYKFNATGSKWRGGSAGEAQKARMGGN